MRVEKICVGYINENCYLAIHEASMEALIIDPGSEPEKIKAKIEELNVKPQAILLTHGHYDHTGAVDELRNSYGIKVYASVDEEQVLKDRRISLNSVEVQADEYIMDGQRFCLANMNGIMLATPGHTPGGACYYFEEDGILFSGDTLFHESVGRSDFKMGSASDLIRSIKEKLLILPDDTIVLPGHMDGTTIGHEKVYNPFIQ